MADIDVKKMTPVDHGSLACISIYSGPRANTKSGFQRFWIDVLKDPEDPEGAEEKDRILDELRPFFEDPDIDKVCRGCWGGCRAHTSTRCVECLCLCSFCLCHT